MLANPSLMTFASASEFHVYLLWVNARLAKCLKCESAFSVIVQLNCLLLVTQMRTSSLYRMLVNFDYSQFI